MLTFFEVIGTVGLGRVTAGACRIRCDFRNYMRSKTKAMPPAFSHSPPGSQMPFQLDGIFSVPDADTEHSHLFPIFSGTLCQNMECRLFSDHIRAAQWEFAK